MATANVSAVLALAAAVMFVAPSWIAGWYVWLIVIAFVVCLFSFFSLLAQSVLRSMRSRISIEPTFQPTLRSTSYFSLEHFSPKAKSALGLGFGTIVIMAAVSLFRTDGWSAVGGSDGPNCPWWLSKDHGSFTKCVSHSVWLSINADVAVLGLAFLSIFSFVLSIWGNGLLESSQTTMQGPPQDHGSK